LPALWTAIFDQRDALSELLVSRPAATLWGKLRPRTPARAAIVATCQCSSGALLFSLQPSNGDQHPLLPELRTPEYVIISFANILRILLKSTTLKDVNAQHKEI